MMKTFRTMEELAGNDEYCPIPIEVIPNNMGINLRSVKGISWEKQEDEQLVNLTIHFKPNNNE